jgi:hypothetical protein
MTCHDVASSIQQSLAPGGGGGEKTGTCYAFQKGECTRGDGCRFNH